MAAILALNEGFNGFSGIGLDFWPVPDPEGRGTGRFADFRRGWGRIFRNGPRSLLAPGPEGLRATARYEMYREGFQDAEAYVYIESHKQDERLDPALAARAQALRPRLEGKFGPAADWRADQDEIYALATAVAEALEGAE